MDPNIVKLFDTFGVADVNISQFGWSAVLDWTPPVKSRPFSFPRITQIYGFINAGIRYLIHIYRRKKKEGKKPFIDCLNPLHCKPIYGVPMGGIGSGAINKGYRGEFCRYSLIPGIYEYEEISANQFIVTVRKRGVTVYQQVLSIHKAPENMPSLNCWNWQFPSSKAAYIGLFPRAWSVYDLAEQKVKLFCRQVSPVIPHDYRDSCLPVCLFEWSVVNYGKEEVSISICCVIQNGTSHLSNAPMGLTSGVLQHEMFEGCYLKQKIKDMDCCYGLAIKKNDDISLSTCSAVSLIPSGQGTSLPGPYQLWTNLMNSGDLSNMTTKPCSIKSDIAMATCAKFSVKPSSKSVDIRFTFVWHMPQIHFRDNMVTYRKRYARWFNYTNLEEGVVELIDHSLKHMDEWEDKIDKWQKPILDNKLYPDWYKSALFNELYFIVDGGTVWLDRIPPTAVPNSTDSSVNARNKHFTEYGFFAYLEGHEYRMYNTYDVHFYSSWALLALWPKIQESIQYDITDATKSLDSSPCYYIHKGIYESRSTEYAVPHDIGDPEEEPFVKCNAYVMYNTDQWKDLGPKYVLQVYRDWVFLRNDDYLKYIMPVVMETMKRCLVWDKDGDGIIENTIYADQTYDAWSVKGVSAYTGGLWLAALYAVCQMAKHLNIDHSIFSDCLRKGKLAYESKLWSGSFYKYGEHCKSIMADQLCGHWYLVSCGVADNEVFDKTKVKTALQTIYQNNCVSMGKRFGAINGCLAGGHKDITSVQSEEYWVGVNYSLAATMIFEGCPSEAWTVAEGVYRTIYECYGLQYQTPEAFFDNGQYRSLGYMRPLAIWAMQYALERSSLT